MKTFKKISNLEHFYSATTNISFAVKKITFNLHAEGHLKRLWRMEKLLEYCEMVG
jgi:hypothetical protein